MGVDHSGDDIGMSQQFLHRSDVITRFKKMRGPAFSGINSGVAQGMATDLFVNRRLSSRLFHGLLDQGFVDMVPPHLAAARTPLNSPVEQRIETTSKVVSILIGYVPLNSTQSN